MCLTLSTGTGLLATTRGGKESISDCEIEFLMSHAEFCETISSPRRPVMSYYVATFIELAQRPNWSACA